MNRRELMIAVAASAAAGASFGFGVHVGTEMPREERRPNHWRQVWLVTRQQLYDTPSPSVNTLPGFLDAIAYHHHLPRISRVELVHRLHESYAAPHLISRWSPEREVFMVAVGEHDDMQTLQAKWDTLVAPIRGPFSA